jgi:hypothetical protein
VKAQERVCVVGPGQHTARRPEGHTATRDQIEGAQPTQATEPACGGNDHRTHNPGAVGLQWTAYSSTRRLVMTLGKISVVLEASVAKVTSPKPTSAVVRQRSRTPRCGGVLVGVSMASGIPPVCSALNLFILQSKISFQDTEVS